ncbi:hypothetical protein JCM10207_008495 [Rhodosporidiobolus poonsookiae]
MASADKKPSSSRLETLPNKLLRDIFEMAYDRDMLDMNVTSTARPICKRLWPFQRDELFKDVRLTCYAELADFARAIVGISELGARVKRLWVVIEPLEICDQGVMIEFPFPQERFPASLLQRCLQALNYVEKVDLYQCSEVARQVLNLAATEANFLPNLRKLALDTSLGFTDDPFHSTHLSGLANLPRLTSFTFYLRQTASCERSVVGPPLPPFEALTKFAIRGPVRHIRSFLTFLEHLVNLEEIDLSDCSEYPNLPPPPPLATGLSHLPNPSKLQDLEFQSPETTPAASAAFFTNLARFTSLRLLVVNGLGLDSIVISPLFYTSLRAISIEIVAFGQWLDGVEASNLIDLISAPRHPTLYRIVLGEIDGPFDDDEQWTFDMDTSDINKLLDVADVWDVEVVGLAIDNFYKMIGSDSEGDDAGDGEKGLNLDDDPNDDSSGE